MMHDSKPADHTRIDVVTMNSDTPYSNFGIDLRAELVVVSVPAITLAISDCDILRYSRLQPLIAWIKYNMKKYSKSWCQGLQTCTPCLQTG